MTKPTRESVLREYEDTFVRLIQHALSNVDGYTLQEGHYKHDGIPEIVIRIRGFTEAVRVVVKAEWVPDDYKSGRDSSD